MLGSEGIQTTFRVFIMQTGTTIIKTGSNGRQMTEKQSFLGLFLPAGSGILKISSIFSEHLLTHPKIRPDTEFELQTFKNERVRFEKRLKWPKRPQKRTLRLKPQVNFEDFFNFTLTSFN